MLMKERARDSLHAEEKLDTDEAHVGRVGQKQEKVDAAVDDMKKIDDALVDAPLLAPECVVHDLERKIEAQTRRARLQRGWLTHIQRCYEDAMVQDLKQFPQTEADRNDEHVKVDAWNVADEWRNQSTNSDRSWVGYEGEELRKALVEVGLQAVGESPALTGVTIEHNSEQDLRDGADGEEADHDFLDFSSQAKRVIGLVNLLKQEPLDLLPVADQLAPLGSQQHEVEVHEHAVQVVEEVD